MEQILTVPIIAMLSTLAGLYLSISKIKIGFKKELEEETKKTIELARETSKADIAILKNEIESLSREISRLEESFQKDVSHIRETYNNEIKNLGNKIEELREEVRVQHGQLVALLTKLVSDR